MKKYCVLKFVMNYNKKSTTKVFVYQIYITSLNHQIAKSDILILLVAQSKCNF